ncbi:MAG: hypothetical protein WC836_08145 [Desulfobacula sp.]|jgi:hypothetical protein
MKTTRLNNKKIFLMLIPLLLILGYNVQNSKAAQVKYTVEGGLRYVDPALSSVFSIGDKFHLEYIFDSATPDSYPKNPDRGRYNISSLAATVGVYIATYNGGGRIEIDNNLVDSFGDYDHYSVNCIQPMIGDSIHGYNLHHQLPIFSLSDVSAAAFSDDSLVAHELDLSNFQGFLSLSFFNAVVGLYDYLDGVAFVSADIFSIQMSSVPVPSSFLMFLSGLLSVFGISRIKYL